MENVLLKKLQIKPGFKVNVLNAPADFDEIITSLPADVQLMYDKSDAADGLLVFAQTKAQLQAVLPLIQKNIDAKTICWIFYPKAKSKLAGDLNLMKSWDDLKTYQLSPCASAAVNEIWTGLRRSVGTASAGFSVL